jgi:hypothetical protein
MKQAILWSVLALIHFMPALAFFRPSGMTQLYGIDAANPLFLLMHHRAALFLAVFITCIWAIFDPGARKLAVVIAAVSMVSFLFLFWQNGSPEALRVLAIADLVGIPALIALAYLNFRSAL